jgi:hypothetical protein
VLADGTSTTTARLEAVKAAAKPPLRSMLPPCFEVILWLLTFVSLRQWFVKFSSWTPRLCAPRCLRLKGQFFELFVAMVVADTLQLGKSGGTEGRRKHKGCNCAG